MFYVHIYIFWNVERKDVTSQLKKLYNKTNIKGPSQQSNQTSVNPEVRVFGCENSHALALHSALISSSLLCTTVTDSGLLMIKMEIHASSNI